MKKLKILLVGNYKPDKQVSMERFTDLLVESLKPYDHEIKVIYPTIRVNRFQSSFEERGKWWGYIDKLLLFPFQLKREARWADIVHITDHSNAYYLKSVKSKPHLITCHDVIAIKTSLEPGEKTTRWSGKILQKIILRGLKQAENFVCISENTRAELLKVTGVSADKAVVIYNSINYPFQKMEEEEAISVLGKINSKSPIPSLFSTPFILHVGANQLYKNRMGVLRIYHQLRSTREKETVPNLVLAGRPWSDEMRDFVAQNDLQGSVIEIQNCSNEEIRALYSLARVFLFPSLTEGFGWPVIEAQACGCPVLTSNVAPLTEIGGDAAIYCDPRDEKEAAQQLHNLLIEAETGRNARIESGLENVERFTPQIMIEDYLALYQKIVTSHKIARE